MSLDACIKSLGKALDQRDIDAVQALVDSGLEPVQAVESHLAAFDAAIAAAEDRRWARHQPEVTSTGKIKGAPAWVTTSKDMNAMRAQQKKLLKEGEVGRFWYEASADAVMRIVEGNVQDADKFIQLLAIYSPQANVEVNTGMAIRAWNMWKSGVSEEDYQIKTESQDKKAIAVLYHGTPVGRRKEGGRKIDSFYVNLMYKIVADNPVEAAKLEMENDILELLANPATIDMWMYRAFGYANESAGNDKGAGAYSFAENELRRLAAKMNLENPEGPRWTPHQVQAAIWTAMKARYETPSVKAATNKRSYAAGLTKKDENGNWDYSAQNVEQKRQHQHIWRSEAMKLTSKESKATADEQAADFGDFINRHVTVLPWEALPSKDLDLEIFDGSTTMQRLFTGEASALILDEEGRDQLASMLGAPLAFVNPGQGGYDGNVTPNVLSHIVPTKENGVFGKDVARDYALAIQYIYKQDAVPFFRPDPRALLTKSGRETQMYKVIHKEGGGTLSGSKFENLIDAEAFLAAHAAKMEVGIQELHRVVRPDGKTVPKGSKFDSLIDAEAFLANHAGAQIQTTYKVVRPDGKTVPKGSFDNLEDAEAKVADHNTKSEARIQGGPFSRAVVFTFPENIDGKDNLLLRLFPDGFTRTGPNEVTVINFRDDSTGVPFTDDVLFMRRFDKMKPIFDDMGVTAERIYTEGEYGNEHNWRQEPEGDAILAAGGLPGKPDLQAWIRDRRKDFEGIIGNYSGENLKLREAEAESQNLTLYQAGITDERRQRYERDLQDGKTGFEGAIAPDGTVELVHYAHSEYGQNDPSLWGKGLSRRGRTETARRYEGAPGRTYFGIESAKESPYKREYGLGAVRHHSMVPGELIYDLVNDPDGFKKNFETGTVSNVTQLELRVQAAGYAGYYVKDPKLGKVAAIYDVYAMSTGNTAATLEQDNRAEIELRSTGERIIRLGKEADRSSFLHESAHLFLEMEKQMAAEFGTADQHQDLFDWLEVDGFDQITTEHHEKFAETFEVYVETGKAPSLGLRKAFAAFRRWLTEIYKTAFDPRTRADLTPEIRNYMDRLLASDEEIARAQGNPTYNELFRSKEQAGMTDAQWEKYQERVNKAKATDTRSVDEKLVGELTRRAKADWKAAKEPLIEQELERLKREPTYQILAEAVENPMDHATVAEANGGKIPGNMIGKTRKVDGIDPAEYAEVYGFPSVKAMVKAIAETPRLSVAADEAAEALMIEKHGDLLNDGHIEEEVRNAMHHEDRAKVMLAELRALDKTTKIDLAYLKTEATRMIQSMTFKEIKPSRYYQAEVRAAKATVRAKTPQEAARYKAQQLANHYLYREAVDTKARMERQRKYVRKAQNKNYDTKKVTSLYVQNMHAVANMYELRTNPERLLSGNQILDWYETQLADNNQFVDVALLDTNLLQLLELRKDDRQAAANFQLPTFDELTAEKMHSVYDQLRHLRFLGGQMADEVRAEIMAKRLELETGTIDKGGRDVKDSRGLPSKSILGVSTGLSRKWHHMLAMLPSLDNLMRKLDGFEENGPWRRLVYQLVAEAEDRKMGLHARFYEKFQEEMGNISKLGLSDRARHKVSHTLDNGTVFSLTPENRFVLALYWGTETSREAVMQGWGLSVRDVENILSGMSEAELNLVNSMWVANESIWPELSEASVLQYGVAPPKLEATPFTINNVTMTGGHMRLFYDSTEIELQAEKDKAGSQSDIMPTKAGSLYARLGSGGRPPLLSTSNISRAVEDSVHFIAYAPAGAEIRSLVNATDVKGAIERKHGVGFYRALIDNLDSIAGNRSSRESIPWLAKAISYLRGAATMRHLAYSLRNVIQQPTALPAVISEVGAPRFSNAAVRLMGPGRSGLINTVHANSKFMENRATVVNREASEQLRKLTIPANWAARKWAVYKEYAFIAQTAADSLLAYPTWVSKFEMEMEAHGDQARAAVNADTTVARSVGSGSDLHLGTGFHSTQTEFVKSFTMFGSFFNAYFQKVYKASHGGNISDANNKEMFNAVVTMPLMMGVLSAAFIMDGPGDDAEPEDWAAWAAKHWALFLGGTVPLFRDIVGTFRGFAPSTVWSSGGGAVAQLFNETKAVVEDRQTPLKFSSDVLKVAATVMPIPGAGNVTRFMDYTDSYLQGGEGDNFNTYQALVEGADKN